MGDAMVAAIFRPRLASRSHDPNGFPFVFDVAPAEFFFPGQFFAQLEKHEPAMR